MCEDDAGAKRKKGELRDLLLLLVISYMCSLMMKQKKICVLVISRKLLSALAYVKAQTV